jgi:diguanylate cyclase (GGDEF)-like protein/PAS domain S-box-containing protein
MQALAAGDKVAPQAVRQIRRLDGEIRTIATSATAFSEGGRRMVQVISRDITEQRRDQQALREADARYRSLVEHAADAIVVHENGVLRYVNPATVALAGARGAEELIGRQVADFFVSDDERAAHLARMRAVAEGNAPPHTQTVQRLRRLDGEERIVSASATAFNQGGRPLVQVIIRDITEQRQAQVALEEAEARYRSLVELSPDAIIVHGNGIIDYVNPSAVRLFAAQSAGQMIGIHLLDLVHPDFRPEVKARIESIAKGIAIAPYAMRRILCFDGETRTVEMAASGFNQGGRRLTQLIVRDHAERASAEVQLRLSEERYRRLFESSPNAVLVHEGEVFVYVNAAAVALFGTQSPQALLQRSYLEFVIPEEREAARASLKVLAAGGVPERVVRRIRRPDGEVRVVTLQGIPYEEGGRNLSQATAQDITEQYRAEEQLRASETRYRMLIENAFDAIFVHDHGVFTYVNAAAVALFGAQSAEALIGRNYFDWVHPEEREESRLRMRAHLDGSEMAKYVIRRIVRPNGEIRFVSASAIPIEENGRRLLQGMVQDITERQRADQLLRESEERYRALFENASDGIIVMDADVEKITDANGSAARLLGLTRDELIGSHPGTFSPESQPDGSLSPVRARQLIDCALAGDKPVFEWTFLHASGESVYCDVRLSRMPPFDRKLVRGSMVDITEKVLARRALTEKEEQLRYLASHDVLTGLPNRALLYERLQHAIERAARHGGEVAVLFLDLDRFKTINDTLGHHAGDKALEAVAAKLNACIRDAETVSRHGGDEFVIVLEQMQDRADADRVARRVIEALGATLVVDGHEMFLNASIGVAIYPQHGSDPETLIRHADEAMYLVKQGGRNDYRFFHESMERGSVEQLMLENDLRRAISREELRLHYQPKVRISDGGIAGFEALMRWERPGAGLVMPMTFIPLAEEIGLIIEMGYWALREAARQIREWEAQGLHAPHVAVNLSPQQFLDAKLVSRIQEILAEENVPPSRLQIEVTESATMQDETRSLVVMQELTDMGVSIAMDDFGTGHSSLANIMKFPISTLKVDRSFIIGTPGDPDAVAIAHAVVAMGLSLKLDVVAEGVETAEQFEFLRSIRCEYAQGYLLGKPEPPMEALRLFGRGVATLPCL